MSEAHKQSYEKYLAFVDRMHFDEEPIENNNESEKSGKYLFKFCLYKMYNLICFFLGKSISGKNLSQHIKQESEI